MFRNLSSLRDITVWAKLLRASMCQVALAVLFLCAAATILYSEHLWLQHRRALEEANKPVVVQEVPTPAPCVCTDAVKTAVQEVNEARQTMIKNNIPETNSYLTSQKQIIVLSYARSGSSFTSDIVIQDPRTFFTFEPHYKVLIRYTGNDQLQSFDVLKSTKFAPTRNEKGELVNPEPYAIPGNPTYPNFSVEAVQVARYFLTCQFEYLKMDDLLNFMFLNRNNTIEFYKCIRDFGPDTVSKYPRYLGCLWKLKELCLQKDFVVSKFIRFPAQLLRPLMEELPNLKVLYLVRDPRGTLSSEMAILKSYEKTSVKDAAEKFCSMVSADAKEIRKLSLSYPDRIKTIRYETIAKDAVAAARKMYRFLELSFTPTIEGYIRHITAAKKDGHNFSTLRKDSWVAANKWRTLVTLDNVKGVDGACSDVFDNVGFTPAANESHLRDIKISMATPVSNMENV